MKLSDAIELGSTITKETRSVYYQPEGGEYACALGAAWVAAGNTGIPLHFPTEVAELFPIGRLIPTQKERELIGICYKGGETLAHITSILHLNCRHPLLSRLQVAQKVRLIENLHPEIPGYEPKEEKETAKKCHSNSKTSTEYETVS